MQICSLMYSTVLNRNKDSRPCSPVQSDTEFEVRKIIQEGSEREDDKSHQQSWRWGELPSPPPESAHLSHRNSLNSSTAANQPNSKYNFSYIIVLSRFLMSNYVHYSQLTLHYTILKREVLSSIVLSHFEKLISLIHVRKFNQSVL